MVHQMHGYQKLCHVRQMVPDYSTISNAWVSETVSRKADGTCRFQSNPPTFTPPESLQWYSSVVSSMTSITGHTTVVESRAMRSSKGSSHPGMQHTYTLRHTDRWRHQCSAITGYKRRKMLTFEFSVLISAHTHEHSVLRIWAVIHLDNFTTDILLRSNDTNAYRWSTGKAVLVFSMGTVWWWVVNLTPGRFPGGKESGTHWTGGWLGPRPCMDWTFWERV